MGVISIIAKKMFKKIFTNIALELDVKPENIQLGIYYENGSHKFEAFKNHVKEKDVDIDDYCGSIVDFSGGTAIIGATIAQAGPRYAKEMGCSIGDVNIVMQYQEKTLPLAVLLNGKTKFRTIDISKEFLTS